MAKIRKKNEHQTRNSQSAISGRYLYSFSFEKNFDGQDQNF